MRRTCILMGIAGILCNLSAVAQDCTWEFSVERDNTHRAASETWTLAMSPICILDPVTVGSSAQPATLTIDSGVVIKFADDAALIFGSEDGSIHGRLVAEGTEDNPIIFTRTSTASYDDAGGIEYSFHPVAFHGADHNQGDGQPFSLRYCNFRGLKEPVKGTVREPDSPFQWGDTAMVQILDCIFEDLDEDAPEIAMALSGEANTLTTVRRCSVVVSDSEDAVGIEIGGASTSTMQVSNCIFRNEEARAGVGVDFHVNDNTDSHILNNVFDGLRVGICLDDESGPDAIPLVANNIIVDCHTVITGCITDNIAHTFGVTHNIFDGYDVLNDCGADESDLEEGDNQFIEPWFYFTDYGYHYIYAANGSSSGAADGVNDGLNTLGALDYNDPDGSAADIGAYGGAWADASVNYVVLDTSASILAGDFTEAATFLVTRSYEMDPVFLYDADTVTAHFLFDGLHSLVGSAEITNAVFRACEDSMTWSGITVDDGSQLLLDNVRIEDAELAVLIQDDFLPANLIDVHIAHCGTGIAVRPASAVETQPILLWGSQLTIDSCGIGLWFGGYDYTTWSDHVFYLGGSLAESGSIIIRGEGPNSSVVTHGMIVQDAYLDIVFSGDSPYGYLSIEDCAVGIVNAQGCRLNIEFESDSECQLELEGWREDAATSGSMAIINEGRLNISTSEDDQILIRDHYLGIATMFNTVVVDVKAESLGEIEISDVDRAVSVQPGCFVNLINVHIENTESQRPVRTEGICCNAGPNEVWLDGCIIEGYDIGINAVGYHDIIGMRCTSITGAAQTGIRGNSSTIVMEDPVPYSELRGGCEVEAARWAIPMHITHDCVLDINGGANKIATEVADPFAPLIFCTNYDNPPDPPLLVNGNYWGYGSGDYDDEIQTRLFPQEYFDFSDWSRIESFSLCGPIADPEIDDCDQLWNEIANNLSTNSYANATAGAQTLIKDYDDCKRSAGGPGLMFWSMSMDSVDLDTIRSSLLAYKDSTEEQSLLTSLSIQAAIVSVLSDDLEDAEQEFKAIRDDTLSSEADSLSAEGWVCLIEARQAIGCLSSNDYSGQVTVLRSLDSTLRVLADYSMRNVTFQPSISHTPPDLIDAGTDTLTLEIDVWTGDGEAIDSVTIDYRFWPDGSWIHDDLVETAASGDSTWYVDLALDSLGGAIEYRLIVVDSLGRMDACPSGSSAVPNLDDTLSYFVSFEPRLTTTLLDTAHIYAPGRLTQSITIGRGGVLYVRPSPTDEEHVVVVDSAKQVWLADYYGTGDRPQIHIEGTEEDTVIIGAEGDDLWSGIGSVGGYVTAAYATLEDVSSVAIGSYASGSLVRADHCTIQEADYGIFLQYATSSGADSSSLNDVTITDARYGLFLQSGRSVVSNVTVESCSLGVCLQNTDSLTLSGCTIRGSEVEGIYFSRNSTDDDFRVYLEDCVVSLNGDTLPEIAIPDEGLLMMADGAGNVVSDSAGVLIEAVDKDAFDIELGGNTFAILDTLGGAYFDVGSPSAVSYVAGNSFSPESVNDSTFIDNWMAPDTLDRWNYTYLRAEDQMDEVVEDPGESLQFQLVTYLEDYLGTVNTDTITEVGFKYIVYPDCTNWTTEYSTIHETDSLYDWWVQVGDFGGTIEYIWWVEDAHGRFTTSPWGADTTDPDNGYTHFLSFEMVEDTIMNDSVTIWAPTTLTHDLLVGYNGKLVIKPWPGASDHTITFADDVTITLYSITPPYYGHVWIQGTESMPITIDAEDDTSAWDQILVNSGTLEAEYTTFRNSVTVTSTQISIGNPTLKMDHCTFETSEGWLLLDGTSYVYGYGSYLSNCVFKDLGTTGSYGSVALIDGSVGITDCWFYDNKGNGLFLYNAGLTEISGSHFVSNAWAGMSSGGVVSSLEISCSEFAYNGGDSTAEVEADYSTFDFSDESGNLFADYEGNLLEGASMASFLMDTSGCGFYLYDSTGRYIVTEDETDTMDVSGTYWYPFDPDTSIFQDFFDPDTSRFWDWSDAAEEPASCGGGQQQSLPRGPVQIAQPEIVRGVSAVGGHRGKEFTQKQGAVERHSASMKRAVTTKQSAARVDFEEAVQYQKDGIPEVAMQKFEGFVRSHPEDLRVPNALSRHFIAARDARVTEGLSRYYARQEQRATNPYVKQHAHFLGIEARIQEGNPAAALQAYERIIAKPSSYRDSVTAVIGAMRVHLKYGQRQKLLTRYPENVMPSHRAFAERAMKLSHSVHSRMRDTQDEPGHPPLVPTDYKLYQNYPNPFNPTTEIRFDIPEAVDVQLKIYNILGQEIATLIDQVRPAGAFRILWDGKTASGTDVSTGMYIYQIKAGSFVNAKKMVLLR